MEEMLRALQAQYGSSAGGPESQRPAARTESRRERLRLEQEEIRERYRRQRDEPDES